MRDLPAKIRDIADPALPVDQAEHRVATALRRVDDWSSIMVGDIVEAKRNAMVCQDVRDGDAEGGPRKLDEGEHGGLYDGSEKKLQDRQKITLRPHLPIRRQFDQPSNDGSVLA